MNHITALIEQWTAEAEACERTKVDDPAISIAVKCRSAWSRLHANELEIALSLELQDALRANLQAGVN